MSEHKVSGLFAGIGGIEYGLKSAGFKPSLFCELDSAAHAVLSDRFKKDRSKFARDVTKLKALPPSWLVTAGFPCQDLSQAGNKNGIFGGRSGLVSHLFRLVADPKKSPRWLLIENVKYMLSLDRGRAMSVLTDSLEEMGFSWAYRVVDTRTFGLPQRRKRVYLLASRTEDPRSVLFADEHGIAPVHDRLSDDINPKQAYGFYWTEGARGIGWATNSVPPIKGGSALGIPSPPAVLVPSTSFVGTIDLRDAERLQGFPENWTEPAAKTFKNSVRWRLVGNAVSTPAARWLGGRLKNPGKSFTRSTKKLSTSERWPIAACGSKGQRFSVDVSQWPVKSDFRPIMDFLKHPLKPLSKKATAGYVDRVKRCPFTVNPEFIRHLNIHLKNVS